MVYRQSCRSLRTPHGNRSTHMACLSFLLKMPWNLMIARMLCDLPALGYFNAAGADESGENRRDPRSRNAPDPIGLAAAAGRGPELQIFGSDYPTEDGTCVRDYIHVNDLAEAHVLAVGRLMGGAESFAVNLGTGRRYSVRQVLKRCSTRNWESSSRTFRPPAAERSCRAGCGPNPCTATTSGLSQSNHY
jgi:UDP-glucose 4-epimerase